MREKDEEYCRPNKSAAKRRAQEVLAMAEELAGMKGAQVAALPVSDELRGEIGRARDTEGRGARQRQIKFLAGVLRRREDEVQAISAYLAGLHAQSHAEAEELHALENWRDALCLAGSRDATLAELQGRFPHLNSRRVLALSLQAEERPADRQPRRALFRLLRDTLNSSLEQETGH